MNTSKKLWGGRFSKATETHVDEYTASITFDYKLAYEDILGSLAHVKMLHYCHIINDDDYELITQGLLKIAHKLRQSDIEFSVSDEDVHMNIERLLHQTIGDVAGKLHTARSRNDQVALDIHLYLRKKIVHVCQLISHLQEVLLSLAKKYEDVILPGYTHLQRAQPIYLAVHFMAYFAMFQRDIERLQNCYERVNISPLGAAALAGTSFKTDKTYVAEELGFDGTYSNTLDAVSDRDFIIEFTSAASILMMHISRLSEELILWASQEFNFISFDDAYSTGSSIMPQKKNPDIAELGRGKTGRVYGALISLLTILKALPLAYNKDLQEDKEPLFDTIATLQQTLTIYAEMLATLNINKTNMRNAAKNGHLNATALADYLVKRGMTFRAAHEVVGNMVAHCCEKKCNLEDLSLQTLREFSELFDDDAYKSLRLEHAVSACDRGNRQGVSMLEAQLMDAQVKLTTNITWLKTKLTLLQKVYDRFGLEYLS